MFLNARALDMLSTRWSYTAMLGLVAVLLVGYALAPFMIVAPLFLALITVCGAEWCLRTTTPWFYALALSLSTLLGMSLPRDMNLVFLASGMLLAALLLWRLIQWFLARYTRNIDRQLLRAVIRSLAHLTNSIFVNLQTVPEAWSHEVTQHEQRLAFLKSLHRFQAWRSSPPLLIEQILKIYGLLLSLAQLYYRIEDSSTFAVAAMEWRALNKALHGAFYTAMKHAYNPKARAFDAQHLQSASSALEEVHQHALQVVAEEPAVFTLFIHDLHELQSVLTQWMPVLQAPQSGRNTADAT